VVEAQGLVQGRKKFRFVVNLADADRGAEVGRLDEKRQTQGRHHVLETDRIPLPAANDQETGNG